jgi:hypothetical protein
MAFTFDEIERIALTKFRSRNFLEAAMFYERLEQSAVSELRSDLAQGYCINNQAVCLFCAGRIHDALTRSVACMDFFDSKFDGPCDAVEGSNVSRFPTVNGCYHNHMIMSSHLPDYVHSPYEPPLESRDPFLVSNCGCVG